MEGGDCKWFVLLEAAGGSTIDRTAFRRLVACFGDQPPVTLFSPDRYVLQLPVPAGDPAEALASAIAQWQEALRRTGLPPWELVRAEVMTPAELERELDAAEWPVAGTREVVDARRTRDPDPVEDELLRRALFDAVTGLPRRELFLEEVRGALAVPPAPPSVRGVIVVHVDGLRSFEPTRGHPSPDEALVGVAGCLADSVRGGDTVARVGPAEFALLVEVPSEDDLEPVTRRILDRVSLWPPLREGPAPSLVATVGLATTSSSCDADDLILMAELAMVAAAEQRGRDRFRPSR